MKNKNFRLHILSFKFQESFTLLEVIVAISILTAGIIGAFALITQTISSTSISSNRLIASFLAQEGIEITRNIRDKNWLQEINWDTGLTGCSVVSCQGDYNDSILDSFSGNPLNLETLTGLYGYDTGDATKFTRKITISDGPLSGSSLNIKVEVFWQERGGLRTFVAQENLYNWR